MFNGERHGGEATLKKTNLFGYFKKKKPITQI